MNKKDNKAPIEELEISVRSYDILKRAGINTIEEMCAFYEEGEIYNLRNLPMSCFDEIKTVAEEYIEPIGIDYSEYLDEESDQSSIKKNKEKPEKKVIKKQLSRKVEENKAALIDEEATEQNNDHVSIHFDQDESLSNMDKTIKKAAHNLKYWGQLNLNQEDLQVIIERAQVFYERGVTLKQLFKQYSYAMVSYAVFVSKFEYNGDFWGLIGDKICSEPVNGPDQHYIGNRILKTFDEYGLDYSRVSDSRRKYVDAVLYEIGEPPESNYGDLFFAFKYGSMGNVDPQVLIDHILTESYVVHKPLLHFLQDTSEDDAVNFILDMQDTYLSATQGDDLSGKYSSAYTKWCEDDEQKERYRSNDEERAEVRPRLIFDNGSKGLCILLPRQDLEEEWVDSANWHITGDDDIQPIEKPCSVKGSEGKRFVDQLIVSVEPCSNYNIKFSYKDGFDEHPKYYELKGIETGEYLYFDQKGNKANSNQRYLSTPYGVILYHNSVSVNYHDVERDLQRYPHISEEFKVEQIIPTSVESYIEINTSGNETTVLQMRPQVNAYLTGKRLFGTDNLISDYPLFTEIPELHMSFEGLTTTEGIVIRVGKNDLICDELLLDEENDIDISEGFEEVTYGAKTIRISQFGKVLKPLRFCIVPDFKSNYNSRLSWPEISAIRDSAKLTVDKIDDWELYFSNGIVRDNNKRYEVYVPYSEGVIRGSVVSKGNDLNFRIGFELPICALTAHIESESDISERCGLEDYLNNQIWYSISLFGEYRDHSISLELLTDNGIEQRFALKLSSNGSVNSNLSVFRDTMQSIPLPAKIRIHDNDIDEQYDLMMIDKIVKFSKRPGSSKDRKTLGIKDVDVTGNVFLEKYGDPLFRMIFEYEGTTVNEKEWRVFHVPDGGQLEPGYYRVVRESSLNDLFIDDDFSITMDNDQFLVKRHNKNDASDDFGSWLENFITAALKWSNNINKFRESSTVTRIDNLSEYRNAHLDSDDILNLIILGGMLNAKILNAHKDIIIRAMRMVSQYVLTNENRFRIIERLADLNVEESVVDYCIRNYALILFEIRPETNVERIKEIASDIKAVSPKIALLLLMRGNCSFRDTIGDSTLRDILGQDAIISMMECDGDDDLKKDKRRRFLRGENNRDVHICITPDLSGKGSLYDMMQDNRRRYDTRVFLDKNKIPKTGIYLDGIRYMDQLVNWYIKNHPGGEDINKQTKDIMTSNFKSFKEKVWYKLSNLKNNDTFGESVIEYDNSLFERTDRDVSYYTIPGYFYMQGLAALMLELQLSVDYYIFKNEANKFMHESLQIAPYLSERDIFMAALYVYMRKKEVN